MKRILGIDPGSYRTGWGIIEAQGNRLREIAAGVIILKKGEALPARLRVLHESLERVVTTHAPMAVAVEDIFFAKHANAALKLGHARGVALLVAAQHHLPIAEYPPAVIKRTVVGRGRADKAQVGQLVSAILGLTQLPPQDAADALAVAITHIQADLSRALTKQTSVQ